MTYKISYPEKWDKDGYHYTQLVTLRMTYLESVRINVALADNVRGKFFEDEKKYDANDKVYFFNLSENEAIANLIGYKKDKSYHSDRNTCVRVIITN